jgi:hypothetical protein
MGAPAAAYAHDASLTKHVAVRGSQRGNCSKHESRGEQRQKSKPIYIHILSIPPIQDFEFSD